MESSKTTPEPTQHQPYVQVSQVDDDAAGQDAEPSEGLGSGGQDPELRDRPGSGQDAEPTPTPDDSQTKLNPEKPQGKPVVLGSSARLWTSLVHVLPLAVSALLIAMNMQRWYWFPEEMYYSQSTGPAETSRNMLQLVAKVYELLVIASLGALTLKIFKRRLVESHVPLGLLTGAYRVGDIPYIFSKTYFKSIGKACWFPALFLFVNTMIATLAGPASAILIVPELDWYPLPGAFQNVQPPFYYGLAANKTWPRVVSAARLNEDNQLSRCDDDRGWYAFWCPAAGYSELWNWLAGWASSNLDTDLVFQDPTGAVRRKMAVYQRFGFGDAATAMTTVSLPPFLTIGRLLSFIADGLVSEPGTVADTPKYKLTTTDDSPVYQPLVQTVCGMYDREDLTPTTVLEAIDRNAFECFGDPQCEEMLRYDYTMSESMWNTTQPSADFGFAAVDLNTTARSYPLYAVARIPYRNETGLGTWIFSCTIIAHWMPATLSIAPRDSDLVQSNVTDALSLTYRVDVNLTAGPVVKIDSDWLPYLLPDMQGPAPGGLMVRSPKLSRLFEPLLAPYRSDNETVLVFDPADLATAGNDTIHTLAALIRARNYVQKVFCAVVTDGLARVASAAPSFVVRNHTDSTLMLDDIGAQAKVAHRTLDWSAGGAAVYSAPHAGADALAGVVQDQLGDGAGAAASPGEFLAALEAAQLARLEFEPEQYGFGSGVVGPSMDFALAVVYTYLIVVAGYFLYVMVFSRLWRGDAVPTIVAWDDLAELLLLVWNSRPSPNRWLNRSSVEVQNSNAWRVEVGIRAEVDSGRAHLVTGLQGVEALRRGVRYQ